MWIVFTQANVRMDLYWIKSNQMRLSGLFGLFAEETGLTQFLCTPTGVQSYSRGALAPGITGRGALAGTYKSKPDHAYTIFVLYNLRLFDTTEILLSAMARAARMG